MSTTEQVLVRPRLDREATADFLARSLIVTLFTLLAVNLVGEFVRTGHLTGLLMLVSESMVVALTIVRRRASIVDRSTMARLVTAVSAVGPPLLRAGGGARLAPDVVTAAISAAGLLVAIAATATLGRSLGFVPANRGLVERGLYTVVRHPVYAGYLVTHLGFLMAYPNAWNVGVAVVADAALVSRAFLEERLLRQDRGYQDYCRRVRWQFVPGVL